MPKLETFIHFYYLVQILLLASYENLDTREPYLYKRFKFWHMMQMPNSYAKLQTFIHLKRLGSNSGTCIIWQN